jgi:hypothetical protein
VLAGRDAVGLLGVDLVAPAKAAADRRHAPMMTDTERGGQAFVRAHSAALDPARERA